MASTRNNLSRPSMKSLPPHSAGRIPSSFLPSTPAVPPPVLIPKSPLSPSNYRPGAVVGDATPISPSSPISEQRRGSRPQLRMRDATMTSYSSSKVISHKRAGSASSSPFGSQTQFAATYEEPSQDATSILPPKIKPYLRKLSQSTPKEDQGYLDLGKSVSENERLAGLGIQDFGARAMVETRGHDRTTSNGSQVSAGSNSFKSNQPFIHPMAKTPRPSNAQANMSYASSINDGEEAEDDDIVGDEFQHGNNYRSRRSMSISSMATTSYPTPLSQSFTPTDIEPVPRLLGASHSNPSVISNHSIKSKANRSRRVSTDIPTTPSLRSSFDHTFSFASRGVATEPEPVLSREERIRAARRKFSEKEAHKDRKAQREAARRREAQESKLLTKTRHRQKSGGSPLKKPVLLHRSESESAVASLGVGRNSNGGGDEKLQSRSYAQTRPSHPAALPRHVLSAGLNEKASSVQHVTHSRQAEAGDSGNWLRFSTWLQTRMLSCGGRRD